MGIQYPRGLGAPLNHPKKDGPFGIAVSIRTFLDSENLSAAGMEWARVVAKVQLANTAFSFI
jgi:hypothetical protein